MRRFVRTAGATVFGASARLVDVQVSAWVDDDAETTDCRFTVVGLPDHALREGRERVRSAVQHGGWKWPPGAVTVNLAPATARKEGAGLDLPIALGILGARGFLGPEAGLEDWLFVGELALDGTLRPVRGALAAVEAARARRRTRAMVPQANAGEAAAVPGVEVASAGSLADAVAQLTGQRPLAVERPRPWEPEASDDACPVRGQEAALAAARIAAAGAHNLLLVGPPGAGKTLVARHLANLLPALSYEEAREVTRIHGVAGLLPGGLVRRRPFRAPHHTTSLAGLVGGGTRPRPGEVSLAHLGVLFLDELPEFSRGALEALRQPLEDGSLVLGRASGRARLPTEVVLVAAMNPCPCGWLGVGERCRCSPRDVQRYQRRISGPLRDRFDLLVRVEPVDPGALVGSREGQDAKDGKDAPAARVARAVAAQRKRQARFGLPRTANARIPAGALPRAALPSDAARRLLVERARAVGLTGRGVHRVLRVARTVADLQGSDEVEETHVMQALGWRSD